MKTLKIFFAIALSCIGLLFAQAIQAQPDLVITGARLVKTGEAQNGKVPYKVNFTVRNQGNRALTKYAKVSLQIKHQALDSDIGWYSTENRYLMASPSMDRDERFYTGLIRAGQQEDYTAYIQGGLAVGSNYRLKIKVDGCGNIHTSPCSIRESNERNNVYSFDSFDIPQIIAGLQNYSIPIQTDKQSKFTKFHQKNGGFVNLPPLVAGKDLIITEANIAPEGGARGSWTPHRINFKVKNQGTQNVNAQTRVVATIMYIPMDGAPSYQITRGYLLASPNLGEDRHFETSAIRSGQTKSYSAYIALPVRHECELEIKVDACLNGPDDAPCSVVEANEINNHIRLESVTVQ